MVQSQGSHKNLRKLLKKQKREWNSYDFYLCKYGNIRRKTLNDINKVDNTNFQTGNKIEKLRLFFAEGSLKVLSLDKSWWESLNQGNI